MLYSTSMFHYWRIVVAVLTLAAGVLIAALGVRSQYDMDSVRGPLLFPSCFYIGSDRGRLTCVMEGDGRLNNDMDWHLMSSPVRVVRADAWGSRWRFQKLQSSLIMRGAEWRVSVPHWFAAILAAAAGGLPWVKWRFSLRTLLIGITLVALLLGLIVVTL